MYPIEIYNHCNPTPKNLLPLIIVLLAFFLIGKIINFMKRKKIWNKDKI